MGWESGKGLKELKNFSKDVIRAGEREKIVLELKERDFAYYSTAEDGWIVTDGVYEILVGASSKDIRLTKRLLLSREKYMVMI